mgnify:CR=1 FL=1
MRDATSPLADPSDRLAARTIDAALCFAPFLLFAPLGAVLGEATLIKLGTALTLVASFAVIVINLVLLQRYGQTIGKRRLRLRIVRRDGCRVGLLHAFVIRELVMGALTFVPGLGLLLGTLDPLLIFSDGRQTLHDRLADTVVVRVPPADAPEAF